MYTSGVNNIISESKKEIENLKEKIVLFSDRPLYCKGCEDQIVFLEKIVAEGNKILDELKKGM